MASNAPNAVPHYDRDTKARAVAMVDAGKPATQVAKLLGVGERSLYSWTKRFREVTAKEHGQVADEQGRLALRAYELTHDGLDQLEEAGDDAKARALMTLNAIGGTNADKINQRLQARQ